MLQGTFVVDFTMFSSRSGKFMPKEFTNFCEQEGISQQ
jgi:hypothetical protein